MVWRRKIPPPQLSEGVPLPLRKPEFPWVSHRLGLPGILPQVPSPVQSSWCPHGCLCYQAQGSRSHTMNGGNETSGADRAGGPVATSVPIGWQRCVREGAVLYIRYGGSRPATSCCPGCPPHPCSQNLSSGDLVAPPPSFLGPFALYPWVSESIPSSLFLLASLCLARPRRAFNCPLGSFSRLADS